MDRRRYDVNSLIFEQTYEELKKERDFELLVESWNFL